MSLSHLPLDTAALRLREFVPDDVGEIFRLSQEEAYRAGLPSQVYADEAAARAALDYLIAQCASPADPRRGPVVLAVELAADRTVIGHVGFSPFEGEVEIGFAIGQRCQGRGLGCEAVAAASRWAFANFGLEKILGITAAGNHASRRVMERAGFVLQEERVMRFQGVEEVVALYALAALPEPAPGI